MRKTNFVIGLLVLLSFMPFQIANAFNHPGIMFTKADLDYVKNNQNTEPWKSALDALKATSSGSLTYTMQGPFTAIYREAGNSTGLVEHGKDAQACYVQALLWYITGNSTYATNAINLINAWSGTLTSVGGADVELLAGIQGPLWAMAGEILANSGDDSGWASSDIAQAKNMLTNIFLPAMDGFDPDDGANFSTSCVFSTMAIAVFTDNQVKFDEAWNAFISTAGCPNDYSLPKNIASNGQNVESGRDQVHSWSSYEMLSGTAEIAYNQGKDPYTLFSNRLLTGLEYWCKYNLGNTVPWDESVYRCRAGWGPWSEISSTNRGMPTQQGQVCNMVYRAYKRLGLTAVYTKQVAEAMGNTLVEANSRNGWGDPFIADALLYVVPSTLTTTDLNPTDDTYVNGGAATTNYGTATYMVTKTSTTDRYAYLKFDLSNISGSITSAKLRLYKKSVSASSTRSVYALSDDSWSETDLTWNNKPSYGNELSNMTITFSGTWVEWDITSYIASEYSGDKIASLCINDPVSNNNTGIDFYSKENGSNIPVLTIVTESTSGQSVSSSTISGDGSVSFSWVLNNITLGHLDIFRDTDPDPSGRIMVAGTVNGNSYTDNTVTNGTTYYYWLKATDATGTIINSNATAATPTGCTPTTITPYVQIDGGAWSRTSTASVDVGQTIKIGPQPVTGGSWSWSGPNNYSASTREITISNIQANQAGNYVATYTNSSGCQSDQTFNVTVISPETLTIQENQNGFCSVDGSIDNNHTGYSGDGFANTANASGNGITWSVNVPSSGSYNVWWQYALGSSDRPAQILVNGNSVNTSYNFVRTGSWDTWAGSSTVAITLSSGDNLIRLEATGNSGLPNIDYFELTGTLPLAVSCTGLKSTTSGIKENGLTIYPNPASTQLYFKCEKGIAEIFNSSGILMLNKTVTSGSPLDISLFPKGLYLVRITIGSKVLNQLFIKN